MKKSILGIAVVALATASCYKERTCECTITDKGVVKKTTYHETGSRSELKKWCTKNIPEVLFNDTISKAECKLQ